MSHDEKLKIYHDLLLQWQKKINLISPATIANAWDRHFVDSQQLSQYIPNHVQSICDIGSGAGFPGLILAIMNPEIHVTLIESDTRKCAFLRTVSRETKCNNVTILNGRIEENICDIEADMVSARALASLRQLVIYTKPLWENNINFKILCPKGQNYRDEIDDACLKYDFDLSDYGSQTDPNARILIVGNILEK